MCKKSPKDYKAKIKCKVCKVLLDNSENDAKISLNEVDNSFQEQQYIVYVKGE